MANLTEMLIREHGEDTKKDGLGDLTARTCCGDPIPVVGPVEPRTLLTPRPNLSTQQLHTLSERVITNR